MKYFSFIVSVSAVLITGSLFAEEYEFAESIGNGAIYNSTSQTVSLRLTGGHSRYNRVLKPGDVLLLQKHPKYSVRLNNSRNKIILNVDAFEVDNNPWSIRWHHITKTRKNLLTIRNGLPQEWALQISLKIKQSIEDFGLTPHLIPIIRDQNHCSEKKKPNTIDKNQLIEDICSHKMFEYLNKKLPEYFSCVHDYPFSLTEVYCDDLIDNPTLLFFICSRFSDGSDEMLEFVSRVLENALPDDYGHYQKLKGIKIESINPEAASALKTISSLRRNNFGMIFPQDGEAYDYAEGACDEMGRLILKQCLYSSEPDKTTARIDAILRNSLKDTGLTIRKPQKRATWLDHTFFQVTTTPLPLKANAPPLAAYSKYNPRVSLCWNVRVTKKRSSTDKPIAILNAYTVFHLYSNDGEIRAAQNVHVDQLPVEYFKIRAEAMNEGDEDISIWLSRVTMDFAEKIEEAP